MSYIVSQVEGRVRVRHAALCEELWAGKFLEIFHGVSGVEAININQRTGSALLYYDTATISEKNVAKLLEKGSALVASYEPPVSCACAMGMPLAGAMREPLAKVLSFLPQDAREKRRLLNRSLATAAATTLISILAGSERIHILGGIAFVLFGANHIWVRRKAL